jgi:hypothetical protein
VVGLSAARTLLRSSEAHASTVLSWAAGRPDRCPRGRRRHGQEPPYDARASRHHTATAAPTNAANPAACVHPTGRSDPGSSGNVRLAPVDVVATWDVSEW